MDLSPGSKTRKIHNKEFSLKANTEFRKWYFNKYSNEELKEFKNKFFESLSNTGEFTTFIPWFVKNFVQTMKIEINTLQLRNWKSVQGKDSESPFPPDEAIALSASVEASPYASTIPYSNNMQKLDSAQITIKELNNIIKTQNYTNTFLCCLGDQISSLDKELIAIKEAIKNQIAQQQLIIEQNTKQSLLIEQLQNNKPQNKEEKPISIPLIQPPTFTKDFKLKSAKTDEFAQILAEKLKNLQIRVLSEIDDSCDSQSITSNDSKEINDVNSLSEMFANKNNISSINPVYATRPIEKYYYKRPSPQDLLFEEPDNFQNSYSGKALYEWNIDGLNDKQIINTIHRMMMYCNVCKQSGNSDRTTAIWITSGFVGQLRGWWDFYLNEEQRKEILGHLKMVKTEASTSTIIPTGEEDAVYTLTLAILQHFVGTTVPIAENIRTLLQNLRCPTLSHFRWYKDTFLTRVFQLPDCNTIHWKSKFIDGLPNLFSEKVRRSLRSKFDGVNINFHDLSYGQIIQNCLTEGLALCNDIKLRNQLKEQKISEKHQLGEFCEQFAFDIGKPPKPPRKNNNIKESKDYKKKGYKPYYKNPK